MKTTSVFVTILLALTLPMIGLSQEFPLGAYVHRPDTATFRQANLRWMVLMTDFKNQTENEVYYLNPANIRLIATRQDSIYAPSRAQRLDIQAEENPNIPFMENYFNIRLTGEPDGNAWWAKPERHIKDYLVRDPVPNDEYYYDRTHYVATFNLKISKTTDPVRPVVKLMVVSAGDSTCLADSILYDGDFASNSYQSFLMHFRIPKPPTPKGSENTAHVLKGSANLNSSSIAKIDIRVYWYDYVETWLDKVVISDTVGQDLFSHGYDDHISADAQYIDSQYPLIQRFLLNDEPPINGHLPFHYVDHVLDSLACPRGWTACCQRYERFIQDGRPYELAVDYYPIKTRIPCAFSANGDSAINYGIVKYENDITYNDSLQKGLDSLIEYENRDMIGNPRFGLKPAIEATKNASPQRAFWFIPQLHGLLRQSDGKYVSLRNPMPTEIRCMVNLALAYGARGILYYPYSTPYDPTPNRQNWNTGLVHPNPGDYENDHASNYGTFALDSGTKGRFTGYQEKWDEVQQLNDNLKLIQNDLLALNWQSAFKKANCAPSQCGTGRQCF